MIRRPILPVAVGFAVAVIVAYYIGTAVTLIIFAVSFCILLIKKDNSLKQIVAWILIISFGAGALCFYVASAHFDKQSSELPLSGDDTVSFIGTVIDCENKINSSGEKYIQLTVKNNKGKVLVKQYFDDEKELTKDVIPGSVIDAKGILQSPPGRRNPGCFDYALYLKTVGIVATMTANTIYVQSSSHTLQGKLYLIKENFIERISEHTSSETAATLKAIMFGDKGEIDDETLETFQKTGTAHILAVSGLHIGIIYAFFLKIWTIVGGLTGGVICGLRRWSFFSFIAVFFMCYTVFASFSPSVVRAVFMVLIHVFSQITNRRYDLANAAFLVAICILIYNPFMLLNVGFQMSFLAVLTMTLVMPFIKNIYTGIFLTSLVVQIGLGPFVIYNFNYLSVIAIFINVPVIAVAGLIVPLGLIAMTLGTTPLLDPISGAIHILCNVMQWINEVVEVNNLTTFQVVSPPLWFLVFYYLSLLIFVTEGGRLFILRTCKTFLARLKLIAKITVAIMMASIIFGAFAGDEFDDCNLTFVDVGQGDCMCIKVDAGFLHGEKSYLFDGGGSMNYNVGKKTLRPYLLKNGMRRVEGAFVSHLHSDHYKGICELAREGMVKDLFVYAGNELIENEICEATGLDSKHIHYLKAGDVVELKGGAYIKVLWPEEKTQSEYKKQLANSEDENAASLVMKVVLSGKSLLVTGDIGSDLMDELALNDKVIDCDILKVPHHGSKYSIGDAFFEATSAEYAVIQVGKNMYGHPAPETIEKYETMLTKIKSKEPMAGLYRNDECGAIGFQIRHGHICEVKTMLPRN